MESHARTQVIWPNVSERGKSVQTYSTVLTGDKTQRSTVQWSSVVARFSSFRVQGLSALEACLIKSLFPPFPSGELFYSGPPSTTESRFNVSSFRDYKNKLLIAKFKLYSIPPLKSGQHRFLITQWNRSSSFSVSGKIHSFFFLNVRLQRVKGTRCSENRAVIHGMAVSYNPLKQCLYYKDTSRKEKRMSARVLFLPYIFKWLIFQDA